MKKYFLILSFLASLLTTKAVIGNTNYVVAGADFQAAINAAAPGDTLIVQAGSYPDNLIFSNPISILCSGTNPSSTNILLQGTVQIEGAGPMYFAGCQFLNSSALQIGGDGTLGFAQCAFTPAIQITRAGNVSFNECRISSILTSSNANLYLSQTTCSTFSANLQGLAGTNLQAFDSTFADTYGYGGKMTLKRCSCNGLYLNNNCAFEGLRVTNSYNTSGTASANSFTTFAAVQSSLWPNTDDAISLSLTGYRLWLGYSSIGPAAAYQCNSFLVGNEFSGFDALPSHAVSAFYAEGGSVMACNNLLMPYGYGGEGGYWDTFVYGFQLDGSQGTLVNNTINITNYGPATAHTRGILVTNASAIVVVTACIINITTTSGNGYASDAAGIASYGSAPASVSYSDVLDGSVGVVLANCISANPQLSSSSALSAGSPCIGAGPPDAIYYNAGTTNRNDMGWTGGPCYNPNYFTTDYPMVFFLTGLPQTIFRGRQTNVLVNAAASAGY